MIVEILPQPSSCVTCRLGIGHFKWVELRSIRNEQPQVDELLHILAPLKELGFELIPMPSVLALGCVDQLSTPGQHQGTIFEKMLHRHAKHRGEASQLQSVYPPLTCFDLDQHRAVQSDLVRKTGLRHASR